MRLPLTWETDIVVLLSPVCVPEATRLAWDWESRARKRRVSEHPQPTLKAQSRGLFPSPEGSSARAQDSWALEDSVQPGLCPDCLGDLGQITSGRDSIHRTTQQVVPGSSPLTACTHSLAPLPSGAPPWLLGSHGRALVVSGQALLFWIETNRCPVLSAFNSVVEAMCLRHTAKAHHRARPGLLVRSRQ